MFVVTHGEAKTRSGVFSGDGHFVCRILLAEIGRLDSFLNMEKKNEYLRGILDFFGRFLAYDSNLMRVRSPESLPELFSYSGDLSLYFVEGVITAAGALEYLSEFDGKTTELIKIEVDWIKRRLLGLED